MTPLKFRVFDPATGKMSIDITLELLCMQAPTLNESLAGLLYKGLIVMQSTGLFDKNGVEIFERELKKLLPKAAWKKIPAIIELSTSILFSRGEE